MADESGGDGDGERRVGEWGGGAECGRARAGAGAREGREVEWAVSNRNGEDERGTLWLLSIGGGSENSSFMGVLSSYFNLRES